LKGRLSALLARYALKPIIWETTKTLLRFTSSWRSETGPSMGSCYGPQKNNTPMQSVGFRRFRRGTRGSETVA
jgi:hypothetical protein